MRNSKILKVFTLCCFVVLISSFVAYRSGAFTKGDKANILIDESYSSNSGLSVDSPPVKKVIMHSSKSGRVIESEGTSQRKKDSLIRRSDMMSSSKSAGVFDEQDVKATQTITPAAKTVTGTAANPVPVIMPSSKSAGIVRPIDVKASSVTPASTLTPAQKKPVNNQYNQPNESNRPNQSNRANERSK